MKAKEKKEKKEKKPNYITKEEHINYIIDTINTYGRMRRLQIIDNNAYLHGLRTNIDAYSRILQTEHPADIIR